MSDTSATYGNDDRQLIARLVALFEPDCALSADTRERLARLDAWYALKPEYWAQALSDAMQRASDEEAIAPLCDWLLHHAEALHALRVAEAALLQSPAPQLAEILQRIPCLDALPPEVRDAIARFFPANLGAFAPVSEQLRLLEGRLEAHAATFENRIGTSICAWVSKTVPHTKLSRLAARVATTHAQDDELERRCRDYADRMRYAPIFSSRSFDRWDKQRTEIRRKLAERQTQVENDLAAYVPPQALLEPYAATLAACALLQDFGKGTALRDELRQFRHDWSACRELIARDLPRRMMEEIESANTRLAVVQAAVPSMPEDWSKPTGTLLALLLVAVVADVAFGTLATHQSIAAIYDATDAAGQAFRYTYVLPVLYLFCTALLAARAVPKRCAEQCLHRLAAIKAGRALPDESPVVRAFSLVLIVNVAVAVIGILTLSGAAWYAPLRDWTNRVGAAPGGDLTCSADRFVIYGKGTLVLPAAGEPYTFPDKKVDAALCKKVDDEKPLAAAMPNKIVFVAAEGKPKTPPPPDLKAPVAVKLVASAPCTPRSHDLPCLLEGMHSDLSSLLQKAQAAEDARAKSAHAMQDALQAIGSNTLAIKDDTKDIPTATRALQTLDDKKLWNFLGIGHPQP